MTNPIVQWLKREVAAARTAREARHRAEIEYRFTIRERQGKIYILCNSTAWAVMPPQSTMQEALALINKARAAAIQFDKQGGNTLGLCAVHHGITKITPRYKTIYTTI